MSELDALKLITEKQAELQPRFDRMDDDKDLLYRKAYVMRNNKGQPLPNVHNVTLPLPAIFFGRIVSLLSGANEQLEILSDEMTDKQTTAIEKFLQSLDYEIDDRLADQGENTMGETQWERACARGWLGARCLLRQEGKDLIPDVMPLDMRYVVFDYGSNGLAWAANQSLRSKTKIEQEYGVTIAAKAGNVVDFWNEDTNQVFIERQLVREQENPYGYVPFVIQAVPAGSNLKDDDAIAYKGESLFRYIREMCRESNRFASILATLTEMAFNNNLQYASKMGEGGVPPAAPDLDESITYPVDIGGGFKGMPLEDTHRAAQQYWQIISELIQMGSISNINYGTIQFPMSGVAISQMTEAKDKIMVPGFQGYSLYKRSLDRMKIRQIVDQKISAQLGEIGHKQKFSYTALKGDYSIKYRFFSVSKEQQIADASIANALGDNVSADYKRREVFRLQNPDEEGRKVEVERINSSHPLIMRYRRVHDLIDEDRHIEARILANELLMMIRSGQSEMALPEQASKGNNKDLIPLMTAGGGRTQPPAQGGQE